MAHYRQCSGNNRHLLSHKLKWQRRSVLSDVLSVGQIQAVLSDLETNKPWYCLLYLLWLSTGLRNAEIRGLTWDCIRWEGGEVLVMKSLRRDRYSSGKVEWALAKTGKERVVPLILEVLDVLRQHQWEMEELGVYDPYGLVFVTFAKPTSRLKMPSWQSPSLSGNEPVQLCTPSRPKHPRPRPKPVTILVQGTSGHDR
jgi:integrase